MTDFDAELGDGTEGYGLIEMQRQTNLVTGLGAYLWCFLEVVRCSLTGHPFHAPFCV